MTDSTIERINLALEIDEYLAEREGVTLDEYRARVDFHLFGVKIA